MSNGPKLYDMPARQDYYLPGGYPRTTTSLVDFNNNIYPQCGYYYFEDRKEEQLNEYNENNAQGVLFL